MIFTPFAVVVRGLLLGLGLIKSRRPDPIRPSVLGLASFSSFSFFPSTWLMFAFSRLQANGSVG